MNNIISFHKNLLLDLHDLLGVSEFFDHLVYIIANRADNYVIALAGLVLAYFVFQSIDHTSWKRLRFLVVEGFQIVFSVCISWGLSYVIKLLTHLPRPYLRYPDEITKLFAYGGFDSFPSGHATLFMALAFMIYLHHKITGYFFILLAIAISLTRVIAGVHFPIDILVGWIIGGGVSLLVYKYIKHPRFARLFVKIAKKL